MNTNFNNTPRLPATECSGISHSPPSPGCGRPGRRFVQCDVNVELIECDTVTEL